MPRPDLVDSVRVLRDEVLETAERGDRDPPGTEVFEALLRALSMVAPQVVPSSVERATSIDVALHDAITRRLAWGDGEETVLADTEQVFDRLLLAAERAFRDANDQMLVIDAATRVAVTVSRIVALAAVARAGRERDAGTREELTQGQLHDVLDKQKATIQRLEHELRQDFR